MSVLIALTTVVVAYVLGSIPTGVLVARTAGVDPRQSGSGNIGATNVARTAGTRLGILTLLGDALKGMAAVLLAQTIAGTGWLPAISGVAAVAGHLFSCFLRFRGGKGVSTALGVFLVLTPLAIIVAVVVFTVTVSVTRYVSLASMAAAAVLPVAALVLRAEAPAEVAAFLTAVAVIAKHHENIRRLRAGTEPRLGRTSSA